MRYYPICLNITNKRCIVVGGGTVGERKAERLLKCGALVAVVSRELTPALERMKNEGWIEHIDAEYDAAHLDLAFMAIGAASRDEVNKKISEDARARGILVNIADDPGRGDFILPSLVERGDLVIAVSTGGKSPALAKKLRKELESSFGREYAVFLDIMGDLREQALVWGSSSEENRRIFEAIVNSDVLCNIKKGNWEGVKGRLLEIAGIGVRLNGKGIGTRDSSKG